MQLAHVTSTNATLLHIAGYRFVTLQNMPAWRTYFLALLQPLNVKGTVLLSTEGININLAGEQTAIYNLQATLQRLPQFSGLTFHETYAEGMPYQKLKVKIKKEIITLRQPNVDATKKVAPRVSPDELKNWLDQNEDFTLLDTRNDYEIKFGTFEKAIHLNLTDFNQLPLALSKLSTTKPIVLFCTGGIRCEKAGLYMQAQGYDVYQLDGGILGYFAKVGGSHYQGHCFVFDERVALDSSLSPVA